MSELRDRGLTGLLHEHLDQVLKEWVDGLRSSGAFRAGAEADLVQMAGAVVRSLGDASLAEGAKPPEEMRDALITLCRAWVEHGYTPAQCATFIFLLKQPVFRHLRDGSASEDSISAEVWQANQLIDRLGLWTLETFQRGRDEIISRQQQELLELSTPVVKLWDGILALPLIGTLDSERTQVVMESLLDEIVRAGASIAIIDITGVPTVDTRVAQHLLQTVAAARLMGADCIISGIRPQIAQTIVQLGVVLPDVVTKATIADAFAVALERLGLAVCPRAGGR